MIFSLTTTKKLYCSTKKTRPSFHYVFESTAQFLQGLYGGKIICPLCFEVDSADNSTMTAIKTAPFALFFCLFLIFLDTSRTKMVCHMFSFETIFIGPARYLQTTLSPSFVSGVVRGKVNRCTRFKALNWVTPLNVS